MPQKVNFIAWNAKAGLNEIKPSPATKSIPEWFKSLGRYKGTEKKYIPTPDSHNLTIKACHPFLDALTAGYMVTLSNDVHVENTDEGLPSLTWWRGGDEMISMHPNWQVPKEQMPEEYYSQAFKFLNEWAIRLPAGYSALFTHPLNRTDLPFFTLAGVVDADSYEQPVHLPFLLKKNFTGVIEAGTPIAQVIPFKRENWSHEIKKFDQEKVDIAEAKFFTKISFYYKKNNWHRKSFT